MREESAYIPGEERPEKLLQVVEGDSDPKGFATNLNKNRQCEASSRDIQ